MSSVEEYYFGSAAWTDPDHVVSPTEAIWDAHKGEIGSDREIVIAYARSGTDGVRDAASVLVVESADPVYDAQETDGVVVAVVFGAHYVAAAADGNGSVVVRFEDAGAVGNSYEVQ